MSSLPSHPTHITPAWLNEALAERYKGVDVASVDVTEIKEGTNSNARIRLTYRESVGLPASMFLKLPPLDEARRAAVNRTGMGRREALFYLHLADEVEMRVPSVYVARFDEASGAFVLLLEDLEATGCSLPDPTAGITPEHAFAAMSDFAALHVQFETEERRRTKAHWVELNRGGGDYGTKMLEYGLAHHREKLSDEFAAISRLYIDHQFAVEKAWAAGPITVLQGDGHLGNLFVDRDRPGFLDWGIIHLGTPIRDVGYFIAMSLSPENRRAHERALLERYLEARREAGGAEIPFDEAWSSHRVQASYTVAASCQVVTFPEDATPQRRVFAAAFLARSEAVIADLDARSALREMAGL